MEMITEPLKNRAWNPPKVDCLDLIRRFYRINEICEIADYARPDNWWESGKLSLYMDLFSREGFQALDVPMSEWRPGDMILMAVHSQVANHAAILTPRSTILHHFPNRVSSEEAYRPLWRNTTVGVVRHPDCPDFRTEQRAYLEDVDRRAAPRISI